MDGKSLWGGLLVVGAVFALTTSARVYQWQDETRLWTEATRQSPAKPKPWINLGQQAHYAGLYDEAISSYRQAARLAAQQRTSSEARIGQAYAEHNLAVAYMAAGRLQDARAVLTPLLARHPSFREAAILARALPPEVR